MENKILIRLITVVWIGSIGAVIFYSLIPRVELPVDFWQADKLYHFIAYSWLALLPKIVYSGKKYAVAAFSTMIILGVVIEIAQLYVPGRTFSVVDILMNTLGVVSGIYGGGCLKRFVSIV